MTKQQRQDYMETFETVHGKRVLEDMRRKAHVKAGKPVTGQDGHIDVYELCRRDGQRSVILDIERILNSDPWKEKEYA